MPHWHLVLVAGALCSLRTHGRDSDGVLFVAMNVSELDIIATQALVEVSGEESMLETVLSSAVGSRDSGMVEEVLGCLKDKLSESKVEIDTSLFTRKTCVQIRNREWQIQWIQMFHCFLS